MVILFLILYAAVPVPISISTDHAQEFQFLPILTDTHFFLKITATLMGGMKWCLIVVAVLISLMNNHFDHLLYSK